MLRTETHPTELQLIIQEIENIDNLIEDAQKFVTWNSEGKKQFLISEYLISYK